MENSYGVGVVNRYALFLDDESDPLDVLKAKELEKERKKKSKEAEKENKGKPEAKVKTAVPAPVRKGIKETQNVKPQDGKVAEPKRENKVPARPAERNSERPPPRRREDRPNGPSENSEGNPRPPRREFGDRKPGNFERRNFSENTGERRSYGEGGGERRNYGEGERRAYGDGERRFGGEGGERRNNYGDGERRNYGEGNVERRSYGGDEGGERRGPPRERGPRDGPRGGPRGQFDGRGKREFDRRSGSDRTGVKPVDKRDGGGSHNWGSHKDDLEDWNKPQSEGEQTDGEKSSDPVPVAAPAEPGQAPEEGGEVPAAPAAPPVEEETKELTLDEWKALRSGRQKPQYNLRKAGEGEDLSQWKNMVVLKKEKADGEDSDDEYDSAEYPQRVGRQKRVMSIEFTFYEQRRGGGPGRGGRGGRGRGAGGGRGGGRREDPSGPAPEREERARGPRQFAPKVDDNKDFPSLG